MELTVFNIRERDALVTELQPIFGIDHALLALEASAEAEGARAFIQLISDAASWANVLKLAATTFLVSYAKELGKKAAERTAKELWGKRENSATVEQTATILMRARPPDTKFELRLGFHLSGSNPVTVVSTARPSDETEAAVALAQFVAKVEQIEATMREEIASGQNTFLGRRAEIVVQEDGSAVVRWTDLEGKTHTRNVG